MCLQSVTEHPEPTEEVKVAWKVFHQTPYNKLCFQYYFLGSLLSNDLTRNKWLLANSCQINGPEPYLSGFHVFEKEEDAKKWRISSLQKTPWEVLVVVEVNVKRIHTKGIQDGLDVSVAENMFVPCTTP